MHKRVTLRIVGLAIFFILASASLSAATGFQVYVGPRTFVAPAHPYWYSYPAPYYGPYPGYPYVFYHTRPAYPYYYGYGYTFRWSHHHHREWSHYRR
jgi:hypothetical protein